MSAGLAVPAASGGDRLAAVAIGLPCLTAALLLAAAHPLAPAWAMAAALLWAGLAGYRRRLLLIGVPLGLPLLSLAPWSGWLIFSEFDIAVLAGAGGAYLAGRGAAAPAPRPVELLPLAAVLAIQLPGLLLGVGGGSGFDLFQSYTESLNGLRVFKGFFFALLLLPLWRREFHQHPQAASAAFGAGLALGLAAALPAIVRERWAFPGLLDFSSRYRIAGSFWEMHVGGAALDAFLVIATPFAAFALLRARSPRRWAAAALLALLAGYACLTTFSRSTGLAACVALLLLAWLRARQQRDMTPGRPLRTLLRYCGWTLLAAVSATVVFAHGAYPAALGSLLFLATGLRLGSALQAARAGGCDCRPLWLRAVAGGGLAGLLGVVVAPSLIEGESFLLALAAGVNAWLLWRPQRPLDRHWLERAMAGWIWLGLAVASLVTARSGTTALAGLLPVLLLTVLLVKIAGRRAAPLWPAGRRAQGGVLVAVALVVEAVAVIAGGSFMAARWSAGDEDLAARIEHWGASLGLLRDPAEWAVGLGLGRFPAEYAQRAADGELPLRVALVDDGERHFVRLTTPATRPELAGLFGMSQRIEVEPTRRLRAEVEVRASDRVTLMLSLCERHLLYDGRCLAGVARLQPGGWRRVDIVLGGQPVGDPRRFWQRSGYFALTPLGFDRSIDIARVRLLAADGRDVLANGDFAAGLARWFLTGRHHYLPWHTDNLFLELLVEQGLFGLAAFLWLFGVAVARLLVGGCRRHPLAPYIAAALGGTLVLGVFSSVLDVPRVAFLLHLLILTAAHGMPDAAPYGHGKKLSPE